MEGLSFFVFHIWLQSMKLHLYPIDHPDYYIRLKTSELEALKFKARIIRLVGFGFFVAMALLAGKNHYASGFGLFVFLLSFLGTMVAAQDKLGEIGYYQSMTYAGRQDFDALVKANFKDPEVQRFDRAIRSKRREPLVAEMVRLKAYLKEKEADAPKADSFGDLKAC